MRTRDRTLYLEDHKNELHMDTLGLLPQGPQEVAIPPSAQSARDARQVQASLFCLQRKLIFHGLIRKDASAPFRLISTGHGEVRFSGTISLAGGAFAKTSRGPRVCTVAIVAEGCAGAL